MPTLPGFSSSTPSRAAGRWNCRGVWPNTSRESVTPSSSSASSSPGSGGNDCMSDTGEPCHAIVCASIRAFSGSAPSSSASASPRSSRHACTASAIGSSGGRRSTSQRSVLPRIHVASGSSSRRATVCAGHAPNGAMSPPSSHCSAPRARASSSTASSAGRLPWMSYSSASMALHGPTLTLRPPVEADAPALLELAADPEVTRWFSWGPYTSVDQPRAFVARCAVERKRGERLDLLIVHREHGPAGITGLSELSMRELRCMVGTWLGRRFWGTGANRESKALVAHLAFALLGMHRLGAYSNPRNTRSTAALLAIGFRHEGLLRDWHRHGERHHDVNVFGLLRAEWEAGPLADVPVTVEGELPAAFGRAGAAVGGC